MGTFSKTLMAGTLGGTVGSLIAPPGEKRRGFGLAQLLELVAKFY